MVVPSYAAVGCRVETTDGARATVRYVGEVEGTDGIWVGVEYDDRTRGKHDGSHDGKRYFDCIARAGEDDATPGSFVRAHKIRPSVTFAEALKTKYLDGKNNEDGQFVRSANGQKIEIQLCLKKNDPGIVLDTLDRVYLPDARVVSAGEPGDASSCGLNPERLKILDLAGNLLPDWASISRFGIEFRELTRLDLTGVRATWPSAPPGGPSSFPNLSTLLLNRSGCGWDNAQAIASSLPALQELSLAGCGIDRLGDGDAPLDASAFVGLKAINFENNALTDWSEIEKLALLPGLERLHLGGNEITRIAYPDRDATAGDAVPFESLFGLFIADNKIGDWDSVDALNDFPSLSEVRLSGNPVTSSAATRHEIVARVAKLSQLNGSLIADQERKDAEIRYLRRVLGLVKTAAAVRAIHPRLEALLGSYGELSTHVTKTGGTGKMGEDMLELTLTCVAASAGERAPCVKKVPSSITVGKLKLLCEKLFKVKADAQQLFYKEPFMGMPELLSPDDYDITYLGVKDGSKILIEEET
ncbi:uncharacterized protein MICPUCDRAFT_12662 [Micromonas pusilla CCMP1545]|uniref:Predicted protein n=1 Tax=Micromonas pusilla (strain CCMP1545) TaxID=564608 RepID=C1MHJ5_MICPC|nr:uncharacterized protein MICPUCDRAFT_12662 [Micromonas pusilla CCMP1545]EEH60216.1 predicted protein [Micromonas pusilla CCMP1545]|eukprot:XP_003054964.1 predicted protein [Micromonas pusilla CCMP1545]